MPRTPAYPHAAARQRSSTAQPQMPTRPELLKAITYLLAQDAESRRRPALPACSKRLTLPSAPTGCAPIDCAQQELPYSVA